MTEREASTILKAEIVHHPEYSIFAEALGIAIQSLEKQIAKKPQKTESEGYRYTDTYRCPNCGGNFSGTGIANYCYHCGQKLDWSDVD